MLFIIIVTINKFLVRMRMFEIVKAGQQCISLYVEHSVLCIGVGRALESSTYVGAVSTLWGTANLLEQYLLCEGLLIC